MRFAKQSKGKKNIAVLLVVAMLLTIMPVAAFAVGDEVATSFEIKNGENEAITVQSGELFNMTAQLTTGSAITSPSMIWYVNDEQVETTPIEDLTVSGEATYAGTEQFTWNATETEKKNVKVVLCDNGIATEAIAQVAVTVSTEVELQDGVNVIKEGNEGVTYNVDEGKAVMIEGTDADPIVFKDCTFNLTGKTLKISGNQEGVSYNSGDTAAKLWIGKNVQFDKCTFVTDNTGERQGSEGWDACIYFYNGNIVLNGCSITGTDYQGQFMGLYGSNGSVTFNDSTIATEGNTGGWSYAMYGGSVLKLNGSTMTATGMQRFPDGKNVNAFYSGDNSSEYDAVYINNSTVDFSDNYGGGFALNNVNIHVTNSTIDVNDNLGNACNSGYWIVNNSDITMNGNRGGHALSCIGIEMTDSDLEILHNGYAGMYIQSKDSSFTNSNVTIRCNGEKLTSYSAGDVWLNTHTATFTECPSVWLGGVGRKGQVVNEKCGYFVAYDLYENKTKGNTAPILVDVALDEQDEHTLFLNPDKELQFDYARGNTEGEAGNSNDDDLFKDVTKEVAIDKDTAKIGTLTTAQLSHHKYDWANGVKTDNATPEAYGVVQYECTDVCAPHKDWTGEHPYSFNCAGTYVYAPLVGVTFDANVPDAAKNLTANNMPEAQTEIAYKGNAVKPETKPVLGDGTAWRFTGWYTDKDCTTPYEFDASKNPLTNNWTVVYAGWEPAGAIDGYIFEDVEVANKRDNVYVEKDDEELANVTVTLYELNDDKTYSEVATTTTSSLGYYKFTELPVGNQYFVYVSRPTGYNRDCAYAYTKEQINGDRFSDSKVVTGTNGKALYCSDVMKVAQGVIERANAGFYYVSSSGPDPWTPSTPDPVDPPEEEITDPDVPLVEPEDPTTEIDEPDVPLIDVPGTPVEPPVEEIDEPEVPLGDAPKTGDAAPIVGLIGLLVVAVAGLVVVRRKFN